VEVKIQNQHNDAETTTTNYETMQQKTRPPTGKWI